MTVRMQEVPMYCLLVLLEMLRRGRWRRILLKFVRVVVNCWALLRSVLSMRQKRKWPMLCWS